MEKVIDYNSFIVCGDTHGNHKLIAHRIKSMKITDMTLFHVGDFGIGFVREELEIEALENLNKLLKKFNCHLYVIRGNHDKPTYFDGSYDYSNLHLMPDYSIINVNGDNVLMVGGAISVDRKNRLREMQKLASSGRWIEQYWFDEVFVLDEEKLKAMTDISYVITHTIHEHVGPHIKNSSFVMNMVDDGDDKLIEDLQVERAQLTRMFEILKENNKIMKWLYGHFHDSQIMDYEGTDFVMLNIDQFYEVRQ